MNVPDGLDDGLWCQVPNIPIRSCYAAVPELLLNDMQRHALVGQLVGVRVPKPMSMDTLLDTGSPRQSRQ